MKAELRPAAFVDRDGVLNEELNYVHRVEDFHLLPGAVEGLRVLADAGYALVVVTNQAGIAKGKFGEVEYRRLTLHMRRVFAAHGIHFDGVYHCPHHPQASDPLYARDCDCRKPAPGMLLRAAHELGLDLARSVMIGDKVSDTEAGRRAGVRLTVLVETGHALGPGALKHADHRARDLADAAHWVVHQSTPATDRRA